MNTTTHFISQGRATCRSRFAGLSAATPALLLLLTVLFLASCTKDGVGEPSTPPNPPTPPIPPADNSTTLRDAAGFPIGFAIENQLFLNNATYRTTVTREAGGVTFGNEMKYGSIVQNDGTFNFATADALVNATRSAGLAIFGHTLGWHQQQNATYLKNFAGITVPAATELSTNGGFENGLAGWSIFNSNGAVISTGSGAAEVRTGAGALKVANPTAFPGNQWKVQVSSAPFSTTSGKQYLVSYWVKAATAGGSIRLSSGPSDAQYQGDQAIGTDWKQVSWIFTASLSSTTFLFDLGQVANTYFIDDVSVREIVQAPVDEFMKAKLDEALQSWITAIINRYKGKVGAWDVVNELFTENGAIRNNTNTPATGSDVFVWSHYLGGDYALKAFTYAKAADPDALFFINDYNLESSTAKLDALLAFVADLRSRGAKVDGIGTQMHMSVSTSRAAIDNMFKKLAASGLKVRVSELDIRMNPTDKAGFVKDASALESQASMYDYVVKSYIKNVPAPQRHGITFWGVTDADSWIVVYQKKNDFPLLFHADFSKKPAFNSVLQALKTSK